LFSCEEKLFERQRKSFVCFVTNSYSYTCHSIQILLYCLPLFTSFLFCLRFSCSLSFSLPLFLFFYLHYFHLSGFLISCIIFSQCDPFHFVFTLFVSTFVLGFLYFLFGKNLNLRVSLFKCDDHKSNRSSTGWPKRQIPEKRKQFSI